MHLCERLCVPPPPRHRGTYPSRTLKLRLRVQLVHEGSVRGVNDRRALARRTSVSGLLSLCQSVSAGPWARSLFRQTCASESDATCRSTVPTQPNLILSLWSRCAAGLPRPSVAHAYVTHVSAHGVRGQIRSPARGLLMGTHFPRGLLPHGCAAQPPPLPALWLPRAFGCLSRWCRAAQS